MSAIRRMIAKTVDEVIRDQVPKLLDQKLPAIIEKIASEKFTANPDAPLTEAGFGWALGLSLREHWPDVSTGQAAKWLWEYVGVPYGAKGYLWTPAAAAEVARQYVDDFGERP